MSLIIFPSTAFSISDRGNLYISEIEKGLVMPFNLSSFWYETSLGNSGFTFAPTEELARQGLAEELEPNEQITVCKSSTVQEVKAHVIERVNAQKARDRVKIWKYQNDTYPKIPQGCVICAQLEQDGMPIDFVVETTIDDAMKAFLDRSGQPFPIDFSIPKHLPEMLEIVGADFLNTSKVREV